MRIADLHHFLVVVAAVAADHQGLAGEAFERIEDRLDEVLGIVRLLEDRHLLAQARGAGLLAFEWRGGDGQDHAELSSFEKVAVEVGIGGGAAVPGDIGLHAALLHLASRPCASA